MPVNQHTKDALDTLVNRHTEDALADYSNCLSDYFSLIIQTFFQLSQEITLIALHYNFVYITIIITLLEYTIGF